jgi:hypothetical protein
LAEEKKDPQIVGAGFPLKNGREAIWQIPANVVLMRPPEA